MAMTLTPGREMRLEGAPDQMLPHAEDTIQALAAQLLEEDEGGVQFGGDIRKAIPVATQMVIDSDRQRMDAAVARGTASAGQRADARQAARGVNPESLPADEYGVVSGRTVQEANRPLADAEAALMQDQDISDEIVRGYREGDRNWQAEGDLQYSQEYGLGGFDRGPGNTDLDYRRRLQAHQGFIRTPQGMIPVGPAITPERIESERQFREWANAAPGSERQATYDPQAYEAHREGVRNDIRARAQDDMATHGTGAADPAVRADLGLPPLSPEQQAARGARARSEDRVRQAQRGRFYEEKLRAEAGLPAAPLPENPTVQDLERLAFRSRYDKRQADLDRRKQNRIDQAMLAGGQPTGGPFGTRATTTAINQLGPGWREIALLDRLTNGRVGGPTPLGVDAVGAQNAMRFMNNSAFANNDPLINQIRMNQANMAEQALPAEQAIGLSRSRGEPMGAGLSARHVGAAWVNKWSVEDFRKKMEAWGYLPAEIDRWIDGRMAAGDETPPRPAPAAGPDSTLPGSAGAADSMWPGFSM
jgi:hypothetical protein